MRLIAFFTVGIILLGITLSLLQDQVLLAVGDFLIIQDDLQIADVAHVIAGNDYRTEHAIQLYKQGYAKVIFYTGGWCTSHNYYHGEHGLQLAMAAGIPQKAVAYDESPVTSTYSETVLLKAWIDQSPTPIHSVMVVSDPFHMRRARWTARHILGKEVEILMAPVPFEQTPYQRRWWEDAASKQFVKEEYLKFFYYIARYQLSWGFVNEWLISLDTE